MPVITGDHDVKVLSMELADVTPFLLDGSWIRPDVWHTWGDATLELTGTVALDYTNQSLTYTVDSGPDAGIKTAFYGTGANAALVDDFLTSVRQGTDPEITPADGLRAVAAVEAAIESDERSEPVDVTYRSPEGFPPPASMERPCHARYWSSVPTLTTPTSEPAASLTCAPTPATMSASSR